MALIKAAAKASEQNRRSRRIPQCPHEQGHDRHGRHHATEAGECHGDVEKSGTSAQMGQPHGEATRLCGVSRQHVPRRGVDLVRNAGELGGEDAEQGGKRREQEYGRKRHLNDMGDVVRGARAGRDVEHVSAAPGINQE